MWREEQEQRPSMKMYQSSVYKASPKGKNIQQSTHIKKVQLFRWLIVTAVAIRHDSLVLYLIYTMLLHLCDLTKWIHLVRCGCAPFGQVWVDTWWTCLVMTLTFTISMSDPLNELCTKPLMKLLTMQSWQWNACTMTRNSLWRRRHNAGQTKKMQRQLG